MRACTSRAVRSPDEMNNLVLVIKVLSWLFFAGFADGQRNQHWAIWQRDAFALARSPLTAREFTGSEPWLNAHVTNPPQNAFALKG
jgi:hypothetical protein